MKARIFFYLIIIAGIVSISACSNENKELKKDAQNIAGVMCKSLEAMKNLQTADPDDSLLIQKLQLEYKKVESEMTALYQQFKTKYGDKTNNREFNERFRKFLNESMLDCKGLSKEDREAFEKGTK